jgi:hypothetical protein
LLQEQGLVLVPLGQPQAQVQMSLALRPVRQV